MGCGASKQQAAAVSDPAAKNHTQTSAISSNASSKNGASATTNNAADANNATTSAHQNAAPSNDSRKDGLRIIIAGPPACGKGSHCSFILKEYGVLHISTGDVMREEVKKGSEKGLEIKRRLEDGIDVDDDLLVSVVVAKLNDPAVKQQGWLLDGFPRSAQQAEKLTAAGISVDAFILLHVPDEELIDRVSNRRLDPESGAIYHMTKNPPPNDETVKARLIQRADDTPEKIRERLELFKRSLEAVRPFFTKIHQIDGNLEGDSMMKAIRDCIPKK